MRRSFAEEKSFIERVDNCKYRIKKGLVPGMNVDGMFYVNDHLRDLAFEELEDYAKSAGVGGFIPAVPHSFPLFREFMLFALFFAGE